MLAAILAGGGEIRLGARATGVATRGRRVTGIITDRGFVEGAAALLTPAPPGIADIPNLNDNLSLFAPALDLADPKADYSQEPAPNGGSRGTNCSGLPPLKR